MLKNWDLPLCLLIYVMCLCFECSFSKLFLIQFFFFSVDAMDLPFLNPYLESIGIPSFKKGCNFAAAGSTILPATASSVSPFSFGIQVAQFLRFKDRVLDLLAKCMFFNLAYYQKF